MQAHLVMVRCMMVRDHKGRDPEGQRYASIAFFFFACSHIFFREMVAREVTKDQDRRDRDRGKDK